MTARIVLAGSLRGILSAGSIIYVFVGTTSYFIRRLLLIIPTFIGITLLVFAVTRVVPGGPIERMLTDAPDVQRGPGRAPRRAWRARCCPMRNSTSCACTTASTNPILLSYVDWLGKVLRARPRALDALQRAGLGHDQTPFSDLDFLRRYHADPDLRDLHPARHLESDPPPHTVRQRELRASCSSASRFPATSSASRC